MNSLATVSLRAGIATPDGGYSGVLVGYITKNIQCGEFVHWPNGLCVVAQQPGFLLEASGAQVLVYDDAVSGICPCIVPPAEACDLRNFNFLHAQENLAALQQYANSLEEDEQEVAHEG